MKIKPRGHVKVVHDGNNKLTMGDDAFQLDEFVDLYWVAPSNDLEENSYFHVAENNFIDVYVDALNDVLRTNKHTQVGKDDDSDEINIEDCDEYDDDEIKEDNWIYNIINYNVIFMDEINFNVMIMTFICY